MLFSPKVLATIAAAAVAEGAANEEGHTNNDQYKQDRSNYRPPWEVPE